MVDKPFSTSANETKTISVVVTISVDPFTFTFFVNKVILIYDIHLSTPYVYKTDRNLQNVPKFKLKFWLILFNIS